MKKKVFSIIAIASIAIISCKKEEAAVPASPGTATVEGTLYASIDESNDTLDNGTLVPFLVKERAIKDVLVTAIVDSEDLQKNPQTNFNYEKLKFTTTTNASGNFSFTNIPAYSEAISVELRFNDFEAVQKQFDPSNNPDETKIFTLTNKTVSVFDGAVVIKEYDYSAN